VLPFSDEELKPVVQDVLDKASVWIRQDGGDVKLNRCKKMELYMCNFPRGLCRT